MSNEAQQVAAEAAVEHRAQNSLLPTVSTRGFPPKVYTVPVDKREIITSITLHNNTGHNVYFSPELLVLLRKQCGLVPKATQELARNDLVFVILVVIAVAVGAAFALLSPTPLP